MIAELPRPTAVAEVQGLYGPFSFPEKLLQKIWLRGDFNRTAAVLADGRSVAVRHVGRWNRLGGPDFRGARVQLGDEPELTGDVEMHLHAGDWTAHGHAADRAYDGVVLHVVLFPPPVGHVTKGVGGRPIPVLALLPLLYHDLEEFAAEEAVETLAGRSAARIPEELGTLESAVLTALLARHAEARWRQKVHFARLRLQRLGWDEACHCSALEILGYRFNRAPMLRVAGRWPLKAWASGSVSPDQAWSAEETAWSLQGVRPANHPRTRLRQYAAWTAARGNWPMHWGDLAGRLPLVETAGAPAAPGAPAPSTRILRKENGFRAWRAHVLNEICGEAIGGTRLDNLVCDGLLPLAAARLALAGASHGDARLFGLWYHWFTGDLPPVLARGLKELGVFDGRANPACHGAAQGLLGWLIEREAEAK